MCAKSVSKSVNPAPWLAFNPADLYERRRMARDEWNAERIRRNDLAAKDHLRKSGKLTPKYNETHRRQRVRWVPSKKSCQQAHWTKFEVDKALEWRKMGWRHLDIAIALNRSIPSVESILKRIKQGYVVPEVDSRARFNSEVLEKFVANASKKCYIEDSKGKRRHRG
jgi:hypothetical protein